MGGEATGNPAVLRNSESRTSSASPRRGDGEPCEFPQPRARAEEATSFDPDPTSNGSWNLATRSLQAGNVVRRLGEGSKKENERAGATANGKQCVIDRVDRIMASILASRTVAFPLRLLEEDSAPEADPTAAVLFFGISLVLGIACRQALRGTRVPYTVALLLLGIGLGALGANINPELLLAVFLPALLFESSFLMEVHQIKVCRNSSVFCIFVVIR
ncbi:hypothetical protein SASPL_140574 [Salvia splendens]|uniref:Cation/H+ exchanger transmembrane domain-containing protein n=1 Tax=Salvia splendens TaxID=180675 RepID=A0A8X8WQK9_SALSN|nr:hypothetical protein SASPL_140574 [Salvia splendens]